MTCVFCASLTCTSDSAHGLNTARGLETFDIHEHVIGASSHLIYNKIGSHLVMEAFEALSVEQRDRFMRELCRSAKHVPTHTIPCSFETGKIGGTTLSILDYAVLITVGPNVLRFLVHSAATSPHACAARRGLKALRRLSTALFSVPTPFSDGKKAMRERPTVAELQVLCERLMIKLRRLLPFNVSRERPSVRRVLEVLYLTLPLAHLASAICELFFERLHQHSKREVS